MLLGLQRIYPGNKLVPDYDVDLVWSVHKLKPEIYQEDLKKYDKYLINIYIG